MLGLWVAYWLSSRRNPMRGVRVLFAFAIVATIVGGYWYVDNWLVTGNPLFPAAFGPFLGPFGRDARAKTTLLYFLTTRPWGVDLCKQLVANLTDWPFALGYASWIGYMSFVIYRPSLHARIANDGGQVESLTLLALMGLLCYVLFIITPCSWIEQEESGRLLYNRYIMCPYIIGLMLLPALCAAGRQGRNFTCLRVALSS